MKVISRDNGAIRPPGRLGGAWAAGVEFMREYARSRLALCALITLALIVLAALLAAWISPQNPYDLGALDLMDSRLPPGARGESGMPYLLGSDQQGRDILSAMIYGLRISIGVGVGSTLIALVLGGTVGLLAGSMGGRIDSVIMRVADVQLSFPPILLALILLAFLRPGIGNVMLALVAVQWAYYARTTRSAAMVESGKQYMEAARCLRIPRFRAIFIHLLPNCLSPVIVIAALQVASAITLEATLSFLGLGVPVTQPSLGSLIANGQQYMLSGEYWISVYPGLALVATIVSMNLVADRLKDILNPRLKTQ